MSSSRSLGKDQNDSRALHSPPWRVELETLRTGFREQVPMFYTRAGAVLPLEGQFRGGHAFLMANGPSLRDLDLTPLTKRWTMTLNNGPRTFRANANCTVDEPSRFSLSIWLDPTIMKFAPMSHFEYPLWDNRRVLTDEGWRDRWEKANLRVGDCPNVVGFRRNEKFHASRWLDENTINWGNHKDYGGGRSVMLAALRILHLLGFRSVYLLGVDFEMSETVKYHFPEHRTKGAIKGNMHTYAKLQQWLTELQPLFLKQGFHIFNCNPASKLTAFPHLPFDEALERSIAMLGDYSNERTVGMYRAVNEKEKTEPGENRTDLSDGSHGQPTGDTSNLLTSHTR